MTERVPVYLAASFERKHELREYRAQLEAAGFEVTSRWLVEPDDDVPYTDQDMRERALIDLEDVRRSRVVVVFTDPREKPRPGGGRHTELGLAIAWEKVVLTVGPREQVFHFLPQVANFPDWAGALAHLVRTASAPTVGGPWRTRAPRFPGMPPQTARDLAGDVRRLLRRAGLTDREAQSCFLEALSRYVWAEEVVYREFTNGRGANRDTSAW